MSDTELETAGAEVEQPASDEVTAVEDEYNEQADSDVNEDEEQPLEPEPEPDQRELEGSSIDEQRIQSEKELMRRDQKLDAENVRHAKRVGDIMEEAGSDLIPCPVCMDGIAGWIYPPEAQQLSDEAIARVRQVIGLPDYSTFEDAPDARTCPECSGRGEVKTGSQVPGYETKTCRLCKKMGWINIGGQPAENGSVNTETGEIVTGPTVYTGDAADPEIAHLRQRGFTVIPPMVTTAS